MQQLKAQKKFIHSFNYLQNRKTDEKIILGTQMCTSFFATNFLRNIFPSDEYLASCPRHVRANTCYQPRTSLHSFQYLSVLK